MSLITAIEISSNKFSGEIQESIGNLKRLHLLNLFGNSFTGQIPSSLKNLEHFESLDLSHNKLSGEIPQQLTRIDTLDSEPSPPPLLISEQDEDSKYMIKVGLMLVSMEYGSELVVVLAFVSFFFEAGTTIKGILGKEPPHCRILCSPNVVPELSPFSFPRIEQPACCSTSSHLDI
ncbi:hypothetical protein AAG906_039902 [Vitis piasezkii]